MRERERERERERDRQDVRLHKSGAWPICPYTHGRRRYPALSINPTTTPPITGAKAAANRGKNPRFVFFIKCSSSKGSDTIFPIFVELNILLELSRCQQHVGFIRCNGSDYLGLDLTNFLSQDPG